MGIKSIVTNEQKLSLVSLPVEPQEDIKTIVADMIDTAHSWSINPIGCVGLACNQIGILKRIIVVKYCGDWLVMINPVITESWAGSTNAREACLSRPGKNVSKKRAKKIKVHSQDIDGMKTERTFSKFMARVVQHEIDHLDGKYI